MQDTSCKTKNLVYAIICSNCGEFYAGETKTELRTRMTTNKAPGPYYNKSKRGSFY
jgi:ribosomal protein L31